MKGIKALIILSTFLASSLLFAAGNMEQTDTMQTTKPVTNSVVKITPEQGKEMLAEGNVTLVDVRRSDEYAEGHIEGAILIPNESIGSEKPELLPDLNANIIVYCRSGRRSADAAKKLSAIGYQHIYDMGGIIDWPYGVVR